MGEQSCFSSPEQKQFIIGQIKNLLKLDDIEEKVDELGLPSWVLNVYVCGSRSFRMATPHSDFDLKIVIRDDVELQINKHFPSRKTENQWVDIKMYTESFFAQKIYEQEIQQVVCLFLPADCVWKEERPFHLLLRYQVFEHALWKEADKNWGKAFRLWRTESDQKNESTELSSNNNNRSAISEKETPPSQRMENGFRAKKCIAHCMRFLYFGLQIVKYGKIHSTTCANDLLKELQSTELPSPESYKTKYEPEKKKIFGEIRSYFAKESSHVISYVEKNFTVIRYKSAQQLQTASYAKNKPNTKHSNNNNNTNNNNSNKNDNNNKNDNHNNHNKNDNNNSNHSSPSQLASSDTYPEMPSNYVTNQPCFEILKFLNLLQSSPPSSFQMEREKYPENLESNTRDLLSSPIPDVLQLLARWFSVDVQKVSSSEFASQPWFFLRISLEEVRLFKNNYLNFQFLRDCNGIYVQQDAETKMWKIGPAFRPVPFYYLPVKYMEKFQPSHFDGSPSRVPSIPCPWGNVTISKLVDGVEIMMSWIHGKWNYATNESVRSLYCGSQSVLKSFYNSWQREKYCIPKDVSKAYIFSVCEKETSIVDCFEEDLVLISVFDLKSKLFLNIEQVIEVARVHKWKYPVLENIQSSDELDARLLSLTVHSEPGYLLHFGQTNNILVTKSYQYVALKNLRRPSDMVSDDEDKHKWGEEDFNFQALNRLCSLQLVLANLNSDFLPAFSFLSTEYCFVKEKVLKMCQVLKNRYEEIHNILGLVMSHQMRQLSTEDRQSFANEANKEISGLEKTWMPFLFEMKKTGHSDPYPLLQAMGLKYLEGRILGSESKKVLIWD